MQITEEKLCNRPYITCLTIIELLAFRARKGITDNLAQPLYLVKMRLLGPKDITDLSKSVIGIQKIIFITTVTVKIY